MYKKAINILSILLVTILLFCSVNIPVLAYNNYESTTRETQIVPRFTTIADTTLTIAISGLSARVTASVTSNCSTELSIVVKLQQNKSSGYETIETWTKSGTGLCLTLEETKLVNPLSKYRIEVTYTAGSESTVLYKYSD